MIRSIISLLFLALSVLSVNFTQVKISQTMGKPKIIYEKIPQTTGKKLLHQNYVQSIDEVNFELSAYLYVRSGALLGEQAYNTSNYGGFSSHCRIYKTDLKIKQYSEMGLEASTKESFLLEREKLGEDGELATYYLVLQNNQILPIDVSVSDKYFGSSVEQINFDEASLKLSKKQMIKLQPSPQKSQKLNLLFIERLYIITKSNIYLYDPQTNKPIVIQGYDSKGYVIQSKYMDLNQENSNPLFYVLTAQSLDVYEIISPTQVKLFFHFSQFSNYNLLAGLYDSGYFYITSLNTIFIIDFLRPQQYSISFAEVNGSCIDIQKFQSTLHLSCIFGKISYISEFETVGNRLTLNRFYASDDITGKALARRIGQSKMAIITDNSIKVLALGLNRNALIEFKDPQPDFTFKMKSVTDIIPISKATKNKILSSIVLFQSKLAVIRIQENSPQLYCEYPTDSVGFQYQVLMKFNTSRCSYVQRQEDMLYGNTETLCQVSVPILIQTKQILLQSKHTNFIQILLVLVIVAIFIGIIGCFIKCNRNLEAKFERVKKALEKAKKGYNNKNGKASI